MSGSRNIFYGLAEIEEGLIRIFWLEIFELELEIEFRLD